MVGFRPGPKKGAAMAGGRSPIMFHVIHQGTKGKIPYRGLGFIMSKIEAMVVLKGINGWVWGMAKF